MDKKSRKLLWLGILWGSGVAVLIALLTLVAAGNPLPRLAIILLGAIGTFFFYCAMALDGLLKAPEPIGTPVRVCLIFALVTGAMFLLCWLAWPPIRRH